MRKLGKSGGVVEDRAQRTECGSGVWGNFFSDFRLTGWGMGGKFRITVGCYSIAIAPKAPMGQALTG